MKGNQIKPNVGMHQINAHKTYKEKARWELLMNATSYIEKIQEATS